MKSVWPEKSTSKMALSECFDPLTLSHFKGSDQYPRESLTTQDGHLTSQYPEVKNIFCQTQMSCLGHLQSGDGL